MADKFPKIDVATEHQDLEGDLFARERELVGDEFKTEGDNVLANSDLEDNEIQEFKEQFPEVGDATPVSAENEAGDADDEFEAFTSQPLNRLEESQPLREWAQQRQLEIEERERTYSAKKAETVAAAEKSIDDFYDNYNSKKEQQAQVGRKEEKEFLKRRDGFLMRGTLWDRVNEIIDDMAEMALDDRDKSCFKGLLTKLKGKENVPGAAGYTS